jgi:acyl dehydratase
MSPAVAQLDGPWFEDLSVGDVFSDAPPLTLTEGMAATHQAIVGDRMRLPLDLTLSQRVTRRKERLAHPALVWDVSIGQSTTVTTRVIANLFYRGLVLLRAPAIGDTLHTRTTVEALRQTSAKPGVGSRGLAVLHITTFDQDERVVLDFRRCAMLPLRDPDADTGRSDDTTVRVPDWDAEALTASVRGWKLDQMRGAVPGPLFGDLAAGMRWEAEAGVVVSSAPELARLTLNLATVHHDRTATASGHGRLVYGGHAIGLAASRLARACPSLATIAAWHGCDHLGPVHEGDTLYTDLELERLDPLHDGGIAHLRARVRSIGQQGDSREVLDWRLAAVLA